MSFVQDANFDRPLGLFAMDDSTPVQDYSPFNRTAPISGGTPARHPALVKGAIYAPVLTSAITVAYPSPVFISGQESQSFTLEASVHPICVNNTWGEQQVLGTASNMDGLVINGTVVSFVTKYATAPEARISYDTQVEQTLHLVGVHTSTKNSLYVNGVLVGEVSLTDAQMADVFSTTDGNLHSGATAGSAKIAINGVAYYDRALTDSTVLRHYNTATDVLDVDEIAVMYGGMPVVMSFEYSDLYSSAQWQTDADWLSATLSGTAVLNSRLVPQSSGGVSLAGTWLTGFDIDNNGVTTSIYGASLNWDGSGVTIEASVDGTTWVTAVKGVNISVIPPGFDPTNKQIFIRATFTGGIADDPSFLDSMTLTVFKTATTPEAGGRPVTLTSAYRQQPAPRIELREDWGVESGSSGVITIGADSTFNPQTVELWIKAITTSHPTFSVSGTFYQNGVSATSTLPDDQWTLLHIVSGSAITSDITISGAVQLGKVVLYPAALSSGDVDTISKAYTKANPLRVGDNSVVTVSQTGDKVNIYAYDWSIVSAR
jgi:hypothetical protein